MVVTRERECRVVACLVVLAWAPAVSAQPASPDAEPPPPPLAPTALPSAPLPPETPPPPPAAPPATVPSSAVPSTPLLRAAPPEAQPSEGAFQRPYAPWSANQSQVPSPFTDFEGEAPPPPPPALSSWELLIQAGFSYTHQLIATQSYGFGSAGPGFFLTELGGDHLVNLTRFIKPVRDDDAPRSLQPFFQRASTVTMGAEVGGSSTNADGVQSACIETRGCVPLNGGSAVHVPAINVGTSVDADVYSLPWLAVTGGLGYTYQTSGPSLRDNVLGFNAHGGFGVRIADTRIDLSYAFKAFDANGAFAPLQWGQLTLSLQTAFARRVFLTAAGRAFEAGAGGSLGAEVFINKGIGIFVNGFANKGRRFDDQPISYNEYGGTLGAAFWVRPRLRLQASYDISGNDVPQQFGAGGSTVRHQAIASALVRIP